MVSDYNSLISAVNVQQGNDSSGNPEPLFGTPTLSLLQQQLLGSLNAQNPSGYLDSIKNSGDQLSGSITIQVGSAAAQTVVIGDAPVPPAANTYYTGAGVKTLDDLAAAINNATGGTTLTYSGTAGSSTVTSSGTLASVTAGTLLSGSMSVVVGNGTPETIVIGDPPSTGAAANTIYTGTGSGSNTLAGVAAAINSATGIGFSANVTTAADGTSTLTLTSGTAGTDGTLAVTSGIVAAGIGVTAEVMTDASGSRLALDSGTAGSNGALTVTSSINDSTTSTALNYNSGGSDISSLAQLGISLSNKYDGTLTFDATSLSSVLNSDFSGVAGFFQNANSWGQSFTTVLNNAGTTSSKGILSLAENSNSSIESTLNADISREESMISIQQKSLTAELNSANEILQMLPS